MPEIDEQVREESRLLMAKMKPVKDVTKLQPLKENEIYYCMICGNEKVTPEQYEHVYFESQDRHGNIVDQLKGLEFRSDCCKDHFIIWNTVTEKEVPWEW